MLATLTLAGRIRFDHGVMPAGSCSSVRYLLTGDPRLVRYSLWPWTPDETQHHRHVKVLARLECCSWQDMQGALCYWAPWKRYKRSAPNLDSDDASGENDVADKCATPSATPAAGPPEPAKSKGPDEQEESD
jgi:hypothetical protein